MYFFGGAKLSAIRFENYKVQIRDENGINPSLLDKPELYHLGEDPSEKYDLASKSPEVVKDLIGRGKKLQSEIKSVPDQLIPKISNN